MSLTTFYSCNAGTKDSKGNSFAQMWSNKTGGNSLGITNGRSYYGTINMAASVAFQIPGVGTYAPGELFNMVFNTNLWSEKQKRKGDRKENGYSDLGSLNYPWLVSLSKDMDVLNPFNLGLFERGWDVFYPEECN